MEEIRLVVKLGLLCWFLKLPFCERQSLLRQAAFLDDNVMSFSLSDVVFLRSLWEDRQNNK